MPDFTLPGHWQQCLDAWLQSIFDRSYSEASRADYRATLAYFFRSGLSPEQVTRTDILSFISTANAGRGLVGRPVAPATRNHRLCTLKSFYTFASAYMVDGKPLYDHANPCAGIKYSKPGIVYKAMNASELEKFFAVIPDTPAGWRDRALFLCYFWTARRKSELYRLRWKDIEPASFDGRAGYLYRYQGSKGRAREARAKELPMPAYSAIVWYMEKADRLKTIRPDDPVFAPVVLSGKRESSGDALNNHYIGIRFKRYVRAAGLNEKFTLHSLRHSSAHERDEAKQSLYEISDLLDHLHPGTTWTYLRRMSGTADSGAALLSAKFATLGALD